MALDALSNALRRTLFRLGDAGTDGRLLDCFVAQRDEAAFAEIVRRHGPMVLQVCRRILGNRQDAEDAFQATWIVLARKAATLGTQASIGGWLHGVASRTAMNARKLRGRRLPMLGLDDSAGMKAQEVSALSPYEDDVHAVLDEEVAQLPDKYRVPLVLCCLEGKSKEEAARQLGWPSATVRTQVFRARELLRQRLARRGIALCATVLADNLSGGVAAAAVPGELAALAARAAGLSGHAVAGAQALALAEMTLNAMLSRKIRWAAGLLLLLCGALVVPVASLLLQGPKPAANQNSDALVESGARLPSGKPLAVAARGPAGFRLLFAAPDAIEAWDVEKSGNSARLLFRERGPQPCAAAVSLRSDKLAVAYRDGSVRLFDPATGKRLAVWSHRSRVDSANLRFAPDGQTLAISIPEQGVTLWHIRQDRILGHVSMPGLRDVTFTPDGAQLLALDGSRYSLRCWDTAALKPAPTLVPLGVKVVSISASGQSALVVRTDDKRGGGDVSLLDLATGRLQALFSLLHETRVAFHLSPTADSLLCLDEDGKLRVWDMALGKDILVLQPTPIRSTFSYSDDGKAILINRERPGWKNEQGATLGPEQCFRLISLAELRVQAGTK